MPLILCHSPKGGAGTSFIAAHLAMALAEAGAENGAEAGHGATTTAIDMTRQDSLKLYFGLKPISRIPDLEAPETQGLTLGGVSLRQGWRAAHAPGFAHALDNGDLPFSGHRFVIADLASDDTALRDLLLPHAALLVVPVAPTALGLAALTQVIPGTPLIDLDYTAFVLNRLDETRRFARNAHSFLRELLGGKLIGSIHEDESANEACAMGKLLPAYAPASGALADIRALAGTIARICAPPQAEEDAA